MLFAMGIVAQDDEAAGDAPLRMMPNKLPDPVHEGGTHRINSAFEQECT
jgi:hypothetical protein